MKIKSNKKIHLFIFVLFFSFLLSNNNQKKTVKNVNIYFNNSIHLGFDSNVMKFSDSEDDSPYSSSFIAWKPSIKGSLKIFERKTRFSLSGRIHNFFDVSEKSNYGFSVNIDQPIGNYQHLKYSFIFIDDIYLRKYIDNDIYITYYQINYGSDCYFDLTKNIIKYESPYIGEKDKFEIAVYKETQYYNEFFTEYDLDILGGYFKLFSKAKDKRFSFLFGYSEADSLISHPQEILTGDLEGGTLRLADRSYKENSFKFSYDFNVTKSSMGFSLLYKKRKYLSKIDQWVDDYNYVDKLHIDRIHKEYTLSYFIKFKTKNISNKIQLSYRNRTTKSPYSWVENLKSFNKYNFEYIIYLKKMNIGF